MNFKFTNFEVGSVKILFACVFFAAIAIANSESLILSSFRIQVENSWTKSLEKTPQINNESGELISISHPDGNGILRMQTYNAPNLVTRETLRNMTNVDRSTPLSWQDWGDYSGYQHAYTEGDSFYRQWWLVNQRTIVFVVYEAQDQPIDSEIEEINKIVNSMTVNEF